MVAAVSGEDGTCRVRRAIFQVDNFGEMASVDRSTFELLLDAIKDSCLGYIYLDDTMTARNGDLKGYVKDALRANKKKEGFLRQVARPEVFRLGAPNCWYERALPRALGYAA